jgi:hypothetical protein
MFHLSLVLVPIITRKSLLGNVFHLSSFILYFCGSAGSRKCHARFPAASTPTIFTVVEPTSIPSARISVTNNHLFDCEWRIAERWAGHNTAKFNIGEQNSTTRHIVALHVFYCVR